MSDEPVVVRGNATDAEVAAVVAALAVMREARAKIARRQRSLWSLPSRQTRPPLSPGPGAWRACALPH
ncbi:MAG: acyl-CoA carboxylase subunit epsilon [Actinobacteria bacterium]|nr:acyl-CoA carboxylase subunit epsilon [Actinomycetota bacterium]